MNRAILFWFYRDIDICKNRLRILKTYNPKTKIFGLYGGNINEFEKYKIKLNKYFNDLYCFQTSKTNQWKWRHGDLMINTWFKERGYLLNWESIVVVQWDMLIFGSIKNIFNNVKKDELLFSGLRPVNEVESWWPWVKKGSNEREDYIKCINNIKLNTEKKVKALCCLFIVVIFTRSFLEKYAYIKDEEVGFLEYKIPTYANAWGYKFHNDSLNKPWWAADPKTKSINKIEKTLIAIKQTVSLDVVKYHLSKNDGNRIFHPYFKKIPLWKIKLFRLFKFFSKLF